MKGDTHIRIVIIIRLAILIRMKWDDFGAANVLFIFRFWFYEQKRCKYIVEHETSIFFSFSHFDVSVFRFMKPHRYHCFDLFSFFFIFVFVRVFFFFANVHIQASRSPTNACLMFIYCYYHRWWIISKILNNVLFLSLSLSLYLFTVTNYV